MKIRRHILAAVTLTAALAAGAVVMEPSPASAQPILQPCQYDGAPCYPPPIRR